MSQKKQYLLLAVAATALLAITAGILSLSERPGKYRMSSKELELYKTTPVALMMAQPDYADEERLVFHYREGLFVYSLSRRELDLCVDLSELELAEQQSGSGGISIAVSRDGKTAYLSSNVPESEQKQYKNYILELDSGRIRKTHKQFPDDLFSDFGQSAEMLSYPSGWCSGRCIVLSDKILYLSVEGSMDIGSLSVVMEYPAYRSQELYQPFA